MFGVARSLVSAFNYEHLPACFARFAAGSQNPVADLVIYPDCLAFGSRVLWLVVVGADGIRRMPICFLGVYDGGFN